MDIQEKKLQINNYFKGLEFDEVSHSYTIDKKKISISVSGIVKKFHKPFDSERISENCSKKTGISKERLLQSWKDECDKSLVKGKALHDFAEKYYYDSSLKPNNDSQIKFVDYWKSIPNHIIPIASELRMYHKEYLFAGTLDKLLYDTRTDEFLIIDYKTNKDLFKNYQGQMLYSPFENFLDTPLNKYMIQLNLYKILLEQIKGINVKSMKIIWFDHKDNFQIFNIQDNKSILLQELNNIYNVAA